MNIYHFGYRGHTPEEVLRKLDKAGDWVLIDVRYGFINPANPWSQPRLRNMIGKDRYRHYRCLGNKNYRGDGPSVIPDVNKGRKAIRALLKKKKTPVIMCACAEYRQCHRSEVIDHLLDRIADLEEKPLFPPPPRPADLFTTD